MLQRALNSPGVQKLRERYGDELMGERLRVVPKARCADAPARRSPPVGASASAGSTRSAGEAGRGRRGCGRAPVSLSGGSIQNNCTKSCCCNGLDCVPVANGTTGA
jgi:hypothetical protein